ncbi:hypothetical protein HMPREF0574_1764 [Mobiluncus curtisii subsp. curtisii ATCC 35241]|uniref:Uncharacterized protein n=1 Tax=Mobiluncus curtisii (strain ATCC 43063 / DSM 2711 / V125) TaxID=548479 RepID=D6ZIX2_MOBCV|nr:hypothetical protein HMPREF0573_10352 [Mobiluncus curtisii ATCC 43063]EFL93163.1 hypothetical protein HMPREF0574_1764 [Mobiluncus curtisii subsp. curtisii ATCC 35241]
MGFCGVERRGILGRYFGWSVSLVFNEWISDPENVTGEPFEYM